MKNLYPFTLGLCLLATTVFPAKAAFSSIYVFGDALSATDDTSPEGSPGPPDYYGYRDSNGRVWVEVLAQRQGIPINHNDSSFDHNSAETLADANSFTAPGDVANDLFIVWVCNADAFDTAQNLGNPSTTWNINDNIQAQTNYLQIITALYNKGVRTLILPNVVDLSEVPAFNGGNVYYAPYVNTIHNGCVDYNTRFAAMISQAKASCPNLKIYTPDFYTLMNNVLANAAYYGLSNALQGGFSIDAYSSLSSLSLSNDPGPNYVFWDSTDPTARLHAVMADVTQQIISPAYISKFTTFLGSNLIGSNRLDVVNMPVGLSGFVDGGTNLVLSTWGVKIGFDSTNQTQSLVVPVNNPSTQRYYRLRFPYAWSWP